MPSLNHGDEWPAPPAGLDVAWLPLDGDELAILSYPLPTRAPFEQLSPSEQDVVDRVLAGRSNAEIARERATSARTVANQMAAIFRKLRIGSRRELVALVAGATRG